MASLSLFQSTILLVLTVLVCYGAFVPNVFAIDPLMSAFEKWAGDFDKVYKSDAEKLQRFEVFKANLQFIESMKNQPELTYTVGLNQFADLTNSEFVAKYATLTLPKKQKRSTSHTHANLTSVPSSIDWRSLGAVTPIKDQGQCGSCWAFSAVAAIEGINKIKTGTLISLSEQELVDCDTTCSACNGGYMDYAFQWVIQNGGITTEADYGYTSGTTGTGGTCNTAKTGNHAVTIAGYTDVTTYSETSLMNAAAVQPISVAIATSGSAFQFYSGGIFTGPCTTQLDHGVTVVGYNNTGSTHYWIVKNSWGTSWGESGYIRMLKDYSKTSGLCGIAIEPSYPTK
ncbi:hypothetical protein LUZ61_000408 [Rhynchospora tenuis]|uniref:Cysteine protease n=1 Tax=Rhynchospora tenuis TaxID=198213 RepID=A0AAD6EPT6_9POAL|nr:hypothetical protein LUZ61_000408 [Rhynchospora tenuis]